MYIYAVVQSFGPLLDTSAVRGENMKHTDCKKGTSPTTGVSRPVYTTMVMSERVLEPLIISTGNRHIVITLSARLVSRKQGKGVRN